MNRIIILIFSFLSFCLNASAQPAMHRIAIFTPLYLDSAFDAAGNPRFDKNFPKHIIPGLEFYYGAQMALDSLSKRGAPLEVFLYDTKGNESLTQQLAKPEMANMELMIAHSNGAETKTLAEAALKKKIPFVSATFPNDAGVLGNPYFVVLNSTLQTHVEGMYRFLQKYYALDNIIVFQKRGQQEDQIKTYLNEFSKETVSVPLKIKFVELGSDVNAQTIKANLDSNRKNICIAASLDENFAMKFTQVLAGLNKIYPVTVMGMPTWDNFSFSRQSDLEIIYSSPFFYNRTNTLENTLASEFTTKMSNRPTDMFFRGYETTLRFALLLLDTGKDLASNLTRKGNTVLSQFDIQPVFKDRSDMNLDYFENKHLYFVKLLGGVKNILN